MTIKKIFSAASLQKNRLRQRLKDTKQKKCYVFFLCAFETLWLNSIFEKNCINAI
jgi:hypothetical protein